MADGWVMVSAAGTVLGGVGAMIAAVASWRAAAASQQTAAAAREALGRALFPALQLDTIELPDAQGSAQLYGRIMPVGELGATDITAVWRLSGGRSVTGSWSELPGWRPDFPPGTENSLRVALPPGGESKVLGVDVRFADGRRVCGWRQTFEPAQLGMGEVVFVGRAPRLI